MVNKNSYFNNNNKRKEATTSSSLSLCKNLDRSLRISVSILLFLYTCLCLNTYTKLPLPNTITNTVNQNVYHQHSIIETTSNDNNKNDNGNHNGIHHRKTAARKNFILHPGDVDKKKDNSNSDGNPPAASSSLADSKKKIDKDKPQHLHVSKNYNSSLIDGDEIKKLQHTFPVHVGYDVETIVHPVYKDGMEIFNEVSKYLTVPKFWNPKAYGGDVRQYLGEYGKRLMTPEEAKSIGSFHNEDKTIYMSIASYRDPECSLTLDSLFERAHKPERIRIAVIEQRIDGDPICIKPDKPCEEDPNQMRCKYSHLLDNFEMDARLGVGPVFARHLGSRYYRGEYFAAQLDAHVRFVDGWDVSIVEQWESANNEMAVLTTYLSDLNNSIDPKTHKAKRRGRPLMCNTDYEGHGAYKHLRHGQQPEGPTKIHGTPTLHPFWAAGFSFARGHFVVQVPYDQYLPMIFQGEEISIGIRGFTFGYDYYTPEKSICFHMYAMLANKAKRAKIPRYTENSNHLLNSGLESMKRLNALIGMKNPTKGSNDDNNDDYDHTDIDLYTMGYIRKNTKFFKVYGIHTDTQTVEHNLCRFVGKRMQIQFTPKIRKNKMGIDYDKINFEWKDPEKNKKGKKR